MELALSFDAADAARIESCAALLHMSPLDFVRGAALERAARETAARSSEGAADIVAAVDDAIEIFQNEKGRSAAAEDLPELADLAADLHIERIAAERLSKPMGKCIAFDEMLAKSGITREELDTLPEVEIE